MITFKRSILIVLPILLLTYFSGISQADKSPEFTNNELINIAIEIMNNSGTCALITLDEEGRPRVRTMDPFMPEKDLTVWFGTNSNSRKVLQIKNDPRVTLYYLDSDASGYVMIHGDATLVNDKNEKAIRWKEAWNDFYPNDKENYLLIKVSPLWMEVSSAPRGIIGDTVTWQPPLIRFDSKG